MTMESAMSMYTFKGLVLSELVSPRRRVEAVETYSDVRDDDIFVCTYHKAGTHWVADIAHKVMYAGDLELAKERRSEAYLEVSPRGDSTVGPIGHMPRTLDELSALPSPRVIMTHLYISMLPPSVLEGKAKVIYVYRDPRDIAVSLYPWVQYVASAHGVQLPLTWDEFFESFYSGRVLFGAWYDHYKDFQRNGERSNVLTLKYEAMKQDLPNAVAAIAAFLGKSISDDTVQRIAKSCTFESMKAEHPDTPLLRKGISGDWKNKFTVAQSERMTTQIRHVKETFGLIIDYE